MCVHVCMLCVSVHAKIVFILKPLPSSPLFLYLFALSLSYGFPALQLNFSSAQFYMHSLSPSASCVCTCVCMCLCVTSREERAKICLKFFIHTIKLISCVEFVFTFSPVKFLEQKIIPATACIIFIIIFLEPTTGCGSPRGVGREFENIFNLKNPF